MKSLSKKTETKPKKKSNGTKKITWTSVPDILKNRIAKLDLITEQKKLLKQAIIQMRQDGTLTSRDLWYKHGIDKALKKALGVKEANKIIKESNKFSLPKGLMKRLLKYSKAQQQQILRICEEKVTSGKLSRSDFWYEGNLTKIVKSVVDRNA